MTTASPPLCFGIVALVFEPDGSVADFRYRGEWLQRLVAEPPRPPFPGGSLTWFLHHTPEQRALTLRLLRRARAARRRA